MKLGHVCVTLLLLALGLPIAAAQEIPPGVRYIKGSAELNDQTLKRLEAVFAQQPVKLAPLLAPPVVCAPEPWASVKSAKDSPLQGMKITPANLTIPLSSGGTQQFEGALFQTDQELVAFSTAMERYLGDGGPYTLRKPNAEELRIYWAMIPFDITEPIFVADNAEHKLLMQFGEDGKHIFWIVDLQHVRLRKK